MSATGYTGMIMAVLGLGLTVWGAFSRDSRSPTPRVTRILLLAHESQAP